MKHRPSRSVKIFSLSALDLFASAMGAFIVMALLLMPYYLKTQKATAKAEELRQEIAKEEKTAAEAKAEQQALESTRAKIEAEQRSTEEAIRQASEKNEELSQEVQRSTAVTFRFLGMRTRKSSFALVIDMSARLKPHHRLMLETVQRIIDPLKSVHNVAIIGFQLPGLQPEFQYWPARNQIASADLSNRKAAITFAERLEPRMRGGSPVYPALLEALRGPAESIILITDGITVPSHNGGLDPSQIVNEITAKNTARKEIHTVAIGEYYINKILVLFLQELAQKNNGDFMGVAK